MIRDFYIKKDTELPVLVMKVIKNVHNDDVVKDMLDTATEITFSMWDDDSCDRFKIYKKTAQIIKKPIECPDCVEPKVDYYFVYKFSKRDTNKTGVFYGEFEVNMNGTENYTKGLYKIPLKYDIVINIV